MPVYCMLRMNTKQLVTKLDIAEEQVRTYTELISAYAQCRGKAIYRHVMSLQSLKTRNSYNGPIASMADDACVRSNQ